jgi:hypothetical protein
MLSIGMFLLEVWMKYEGKQDARQAFTRPLLFLVGWEGAEFDLQRDHVRKLLGHVTVTVTSVPLLM